MIDTPTHKRRAGPPADLPIRNGILAALLAVDYEQLLPKLERVTLARGEIVHRADEEIEEVYFPEQAVIAMVDRMDNGRTIEVGMIGHEGIVGINVVLGGIFTPDQAIVQFAGAAMRMKSKDLKKELRTRNPLQPPLLGYARTFLAVISQSVACCQYHTVEQRLARWLLVMHDYAGSREFPMEHKSIALMLGVRREGVTEAASKLQESALIRYRRGRISVLDGPRLGKKACECYRYIKQQYRELHVEFPRLPARR
jgi:CRP-like cAMP-binding protein